ncbi:TetR/AcrR family transcriptional regulator [Sphingomonas phyllosphaerae]|uniref:TetR/AcrR family transcriptional regulator n=1 Tax=Sphingomonas phyllosphaerae TaxID=257003 RepID=UPI0024130D17|nr:TetR/AcrR family transcriptional regulator [Sphingomonas phyllosphaerae]
MRVSRDQMAMNRVRILTEASRLFRERGFDAVTVSEVMKAAGQTHGGFYSHFASKDDLVAQTVAFALDGEGETMPDLQGWIDVYLSPLHRDHAGEGCPTASLAGLMRQQTLEARAAMAKGLDAQIDRLARSLPVGNAVERRREAIGRWSAMVGALVMARAVDDPALADELLTSTRAWIGAAGDADSDISGETSR